MNRNLQWRWILLAPMLASTTHAATWIRDFQGQADQYRLERNGQALAIEYYLTLQNGDRLWATDKGYALRLERDDGTVVVVQSTNSPYTVQDTGKAPGTVANLVGWAGAWLRTQKENGAALPTAILVARNEGKPIKFPLAPEGSTRLSAGNQPLSLAWNGGTPPFRVRLERQGKEPVVFDQTNLDQRRFSSPPLELSAGAYQLVVSDAVQQQATVAIDVVPMATLPPAPAGLLSTSTPDSLKETVYAVWLASQDQALILEAYQRALRWQSQHEPAKWLVYSLEKGKRPEPPTFSKP